MEEITAAYVRRLLPRRDPWATRVPSARCCAYAAAWAFPARRFSPARRRCAPGRGLVYLGVPEPVWPVAAMKCDEVMPFPLPSEEGSCPPGRGGHPAAGRGCDAVLVGCGLGRAPGARAGAAAAGPARPLVLDADGINALSGHMDALSRRRDRITVLTPHEGEFVRAGGDLSPGRGAGGGGLRPGARGIPGAEGAGDHRGRPGRAADGELHRELRHGQRGGSGDVLAGMLVSLLGLGLRLWTPAAPRCGFTDGPGTWPPGRWALWGMTPSDLLDRSRRLCGRVTGKAYPKELCSFG